MVLVMGQNMSDLSDDENRGLGSHQSPTRNNGNGRYNLRENPRPTGNSEPVPPRDPREEDRQRATQAISSIIQLLAGFDQGNEGNRDGSALVTVEDMLEAESDDWDDPRVRFDEMLFQTSDDDDSSYDDDEIAASVGVHHVLNSMRSQNKSPPKPSVELLRSLNDSDFSRLTRESLGMTPLQSSRRDDQLTKPPNDSVQQQTLAQLLSDREVRFSTFVHIVLLNE